MRQGLHRKVHVLWCHNLCTFLHETSNKTPTLSNLTTPLLAVQKALLQQLNPSSAPLRSLRQLGWPLGSKQLLGLLHDQLGEAAGTNVQVMPFVLEGMFSSATTLANVVKDSLEEGRGMPQVEQLLLTVSPKVWTSRRGVPGSGSGAGVIAWSSLLLVSH